MPGWTPPVSPRRHGDTPRRYETEYCETRLKASNAAARMRRDGAVWTHVSHDFRLGWRVDGRWQDGAVADGTLGMERG